MSLSTLRPGHFTVSDRNRYPTAPPAGYGGRGWIDSTAAFEELANRVQLPVQQTKRKSEKNSIDRTCINPLL